MVLLNSPELSIDLMVEYKKGLFSNGELGWGLLMFHSLIYPLGKFYILQKH